MLLICGVGEDLWESLGLQGDQTSHPNGNPSWIFFGMTDAEPESPILWPPDVKNWLIGKNPDAGKDWGQEAKEKREDEMVGRHHHLNGRVWASSRRWWRTGKPGMLQSMGLHSQNWLRNYQHNFDNWNFSMLWNQEKWVPWFCFSFSNLF